MKKNGKMSDIWKRILCVVMVVCMVAPSVMTYAAADMSPQGMVQTGEDSAEAPRTEVRTLGDGEVTVSVSDVYYSLDGTGKSAASIPKDAKSGAYLLTEDMLGQDMLYGIDLQMNMAAGENGWDIINGDSYQVSLNNEIGGSPAGFVTGQSGKVLTSEGIEFGTYVIDGQLLTFTFNNYFADTGKDIVAAKIIVNFTIDESKLENEKSQNFKMNLGEAGVEITIPGSHGGSQSNGDDLNVFPGGNEDNISNDNCGSISGDRNEIFSGIIPAQSSWTVGETAYDIESTPAGTFKAKINTTVCDKDSKRVNFIINDIDDTTLGLNTAYLQEVYNFATELGAYPDPESQEEIAWWKDIKNTGDLKPLQFSINLGKKELWELPGGEVESKSPIDIGTKVVLSTEGENPLGIADGIFSEDSSKNLILTVTYRNEIIYLYNEGVAAGLSFGLDLDTSKWSEDETYNIGWDDQEGIKLTGNGGSDKPDSGSTGFEIEKTVQGGSNPGGDTTITDVYFTYQIKVEKWKKETSEDGNEVKSGITLAGSTLSDKIPGELNVQAVRVNNRDRFGEEAVNPCTYDAATGQLNYTFIEADDILSEGTVTSPTIVEIDVVLNQTEIPSNGITVKNEATISDGENTPSKNSEQTTTLKKPQIFKEGAVDGLDTKRVSWKVTVDSYFSAEVDSYIVDRIDGSLQTFDKKSLTISGGESAKKLSVEDLTESFITCPSYEVLKAPGKGAGIIREALESYRKNDGSYQNDAYLLKTEKVDDKFDYILIIPYRQYDNEKRLITYDTILNAAALPEKDAEVKNDVSLVWDYQGLGIGPWELDWSVDIDKNVVLKGDIGFKTGNYEEKTQTATWTVRVNPYGETLANVFVKDTFDSTKQILKSVELIPYTKNSTTGKFESSETIPLTEAESNPTVLKNYTFKSENSSQEMLLTVPLGNLDDTIRYDVVIKTKVIDPSILSVQETAKLKNIATIIYNGGTSSDISTTIDIPNTLIKKNVLGTYDYNENSVTWEVTINPDKTDKIPITGAALIETLPFGSTLTKWSVKKGDNGEFVEAVNGTAEVGGADGKVIISQATSAEEKKGTGTADGKFTFDETGKFIQRTETFEFDKEITDSYTFQFTTTFTDTLYKQTFLMGYDRVRMENNATLTGKYKETDISKANVMAETTITPQPVAKHGYASDKTDNLPAKITWTIDINRARANIQGGVIEENFGASKLLELDPESIKISELTVGSNGTVNGSTPMEMSDIGEISYYDSLDGFRIQLKNEPLEKYIRIVFDTYIVDTPSNFNDLTNSITVSSKGVFSYSKNDVKSENTLTFNFDSWARASKSPMLRVMKYAALHEENPDDNNHLMLPGAMMKLDAFVLDDKTGNYVFDSSKSKQRITNSQGYANFVCLKENVIYDLYEIKAPEGYEASELHKYYTLTADGNLESSEAVLVKGEEAKTITPNLIKKTTGGYQPEDRDILYANHPKETMGISILKLDGRGEKLSGITFKLQHASSAIKVHKATTDANGKVTFPDIDPGKYTLTEIIPTDMKEFYSVQPIVLTIAAGDDNVPRITVDSNPNGDKVAVSLEAGSTNNLIVQNAYKSGTIKLKKIEAGTDKPLEGAEFAIYEGIGINSYSSTPRTTTSSDVNGIITYSNIPFNPYGYKIVETKAPEGYINESDPIHISGDDMRKTADGDSFNLDISTSKAVSNNRVCADVTFDKYLRIDILKIPLMDRTFILKYAGADSYIMGKYGFTRDSNGDWFRTLSQSNGNQIETPSYTFKNVPLGNYKLIEKSLEGDSYSKVEIEIDLMAAYKEALKKPAVLPSGKPFVYKVTTDGAEEGTVINTLLETDVYLNKVDGVTGELINGAQFTLEGQLDNREGVNFGPKTYTAQDGKLRIENLPIGTYTLEETKAPENYVIGGKYTITVVSEYDEAENANVAKAYIKPESAVEAGNGTLCSDEREPYPIPNNAIEGTLRLKKIGKAVLEGVLENAELSGVTFELTPVVKQEDGSWVTMKDSEGKDRVLTSGVTGSNGNLEINKLPYGNYLLTETAPDGYFAMKPVLLLKKGSDNESSYNFMKDEEAGNVITGFDWNGGYYSAEKTTDEQGNVSYRAEDAIKSYHKGNENVIENNPVVTNAEFTKIVIKDLTGETQGELLEGAKFTVERLGSGGGVDDPLKFGDANDVSEGYKPYALCDSELVSDKDGIVTIENLVCGMYRITEIEWPQHARPVDAVPEVVMYLRVAKSDVDGEFYVTVYDKEGEAGAPLGESIKIVESTCRDDVADVGIVANSPYELGKVSFIKVGSGGNKPLGGALFGLYRKNTETNEYSPVTMYADRKHVTTETGDRGIGIFQYLTYGTYAIKELEAPDGHVLDNTYYEFEISENNLNGVISNEGISENKITNIQNSFQIQKQDMGGQLLNGAVFTVSGKFADTSTAKTYTVNGTSVPVAGQLIAGEEYVIREVTAPAGYTLANPVTVFIDENGQLYDTAENRIADNKVIIKDSMIDMGLYKISADDFAAAGTGAVSRLEGAEFTVTPASGFSFADGSRSLVINDQNYGTAFRGKLTAGGTYTVTETKAPYGYTVAAPFTFTVNANGGVSIAAAARDYVKASANGQFVIYVADEQGTGEVTLVKKDAESGMDLAEAGFKLYRKTAAGSYTLVADKTLYTGNTYKMTGTSAIDNGTANSPANGKFTVNGLPWGSYQFVEVTAPKGYVLDATPYTFEITGTKANGMSVDLGTVKNHKTAVKVFKVDESNAPLSGATLAILDKDGKEVEHWTTDGTVHIVCGLIPGSAYTLHEVKAPDGYKLAEDITFTVPANGQYELSMTDKKEAKPTPTPDGKTGAVTVTKTIYFDEKPWAIFDLSFYTALFSDAELTNRVSEVKELAFTGSYSTTASFENLPLGTYYVAEVDEFGDVYDGSDIGMEVEIVDQTCALTKASPHGSAVIKNMLPKLPEGHYYEPTGKLTVTKKVLNKDKTAATVKNTSFYVTLFSDADYLLAVSDPMEIEIANGSSGTVIFDKLALGTYYLAETDEYGFPVDAETDEFAYTPTFSEDTIEITDENQSVEVTLTNTLKKGEAAPTATPKATVTTRPGTYSSSPRRSTLSTGSSSKASNAKTGDETPLFWYFILLAAASAGIILTVSVKRRKIK